MNNPHRLLQRQIKRYLGEMDSLPDNVRTFMQAVNDTYNEFDQDRAMLEHAFDLSSEELFEANRELQHHRQHLERTVEERTRDLAQSNERLSMEVQEREKAEKRLALLNECLLRFDGNSLGNIRQLIALCGSQFQALNVEYGLMIKGSYRSMACWSASDNESDPFTDHDVHGFMLSKNALDISGDLSVLYPPYSGPFQAVIRKTFSISDEQTGILLLGYDGQVALSEPDREYLRILTAALKSQEERRQVKAELDLSEKRFSFLARSAQDGIIVSDQEGYATYWNPAAERIYGYSAEEVLGKPLQEVLGPPPDRDYVTDRMKLQRSGGGPLTGSTAEIRAVRKDGAEVLLEISISSSQNFNGGWDTLGIVRDITERKRWEESLKKAKEDAESASTAKSQFLANMSHEIRTPLNGILGMMELLSTDHLSDRQQQFLQMARSSGEALLNVINDILDFSKIEAGHMELSLSEFNLRHLLEDVTGLFTESANRKGLELIYALEDDVPIPLKGDAYRIRQILVNLVGNGIKFTERGTVVVRVAALNRQEGRIMLKFLVSDTGIGLSEETQRYIFEAFSQGDGTVTRRFGGTGLGLAIAKQLAQMMGGTIGVESRLGQGSTFWVTLSLEEQQNLRPIVDPSINNSLEGLHVLVVDDNEINLAVLCHQLSRLGAETDQIDNGNQALQMLRSAVREGNPYHFAILDVMMPQMNGFDLVRFIHMDSSLDGLKIIMLASPDVSLTEKETLGKRIFAYLTKPIRQTELLNTLGSKENEETDEDRAGKDGAVEQPAEACFAGHGVLLVEDNEVNQAVGKAMLESLGCVVEVASDGKECLKRLAACSYDLVLMDCQMPELDGYETTKIIRGQEAGLNRIPILALTAHAMEGDRDVCLAVGMDDYLSKPFTAQQLREALCRLMPPVNA